MAFANCSYNEGEYKYLNSPVRVCASFYKDQNMSSYRLKGYTNTTQALLCQCT